MRTLVLLRGCPGVGKSTWIKNKELEQYTLSADNIRLLYQSPLLDESGKYIISPKNDHKVWNLLFKLLEDRMERGEFTVIDATHSKQSAISRYKSLAQRYRYRTYVVDFSDVPLEIILNQNKKRPEHKIVPESVIYNHYIRMKTETVPRWVTLIKPDDFRTVMKYRATNYDGVYDSIHVFGDIHGCNTALQTYLNQNGGIKDNELYIFCGDYLDRGIENADILKFLVSIKDNRNVIFLEGNHDRYIMQYGNDEETVSRTFNNKTKPELDAANIDKKDIRQLARRFSQLAYFEFNGVKYVVTHGGISGLPDNFLYVATEQLIKGVGDYETDIDYLWNQNTQDNKKIVAIHGHRNVFKLPVQASKNSYNLEGNVERGGYLRVVTISKEGVQTHEIKNDVFNPYLNPNYKPEGITVGKITSADLSLEEISFLNPVEKFVKGLQKHPYVQETELPNNISSFNFTRKAFKGKKWDEVNVKARGLFINKKTNEIVNRGYEKFFNVNERTATKVTTLADSLKFPVVAYEKENGYLGLVGYDLQTERLIFSSKSLTHDTGSPHAKWLQEMFYKTFTVEQAEEIADYIKNNNVSLIFEVILPEKDPHIIEYPCDKLVLLDIVKRQLTFQKLPYGEVWEFANQYGVAYKRKAFTFSNWTDFYRWYLASNKDMTIQKEGYVIEDSTGFMFKLKLPYYNFWKQMRGIKHKVANKHSHMVNTGSLITPLHSNFFAWAKTKDKDYLKDNSIIKIRNDFYKETE